MPVPVRRSHGWATPSRNDFTRRGTGIVVDRACSASDSGFVGEQGRMPFRALSVDKDAAPKFVVDSATFKTLAVANAPARDVT